MDAFRSGLFFLVAVLAGSVPAQAEPWVAVLEQSTLGFNAEQQGAPFEGRFNRFTAQFDLDPADPTNAGNARIEAAIDMDSVDTLYDERDEALREAEWFAVEQWPEGRFETTRIRRGGDGYIADGLLTLKDVTRPVELKFTLERVADGRLRFSGESVVSRLAFGVGTGQWTNTDWVGDAVTIQVSLILRQALP